MLSIESVPDLLNFISGIGTLQSRFCDLLKIAVKEEGSLLQLKHTPYPAKRMPGCASLVHQACR